MEATRRGFLSGLLGVTVVAVLPKMAVPATDPFKIVAPDGITYQWVRTALLGVPDPENVQGRLDTGWSFVTPSAHPGAPTSSLGHAIEETGLILMQKPTFKVAEDAAREKAEQEKVRADRGFHAGAVSIDGGEITGTVTHRIETA